MPEKNQPQVHISAKHDSDVTPSGGGITQGRKRKSFRSQLFSTNGLSDISSSSPKASFDTKELNSSAPPRALQSPQKRRGSISSRKVAPKRSIKRHKSVPGLKRKGAAAAPLGNKTKAPRPGNTSRTMKLAPRKVVPLSNQKKKVSPKIVPKSAVNPPKLVIAPVSKRKSSKRRSSKRTKEFRKSNFTSRQSDITSSSEGSVVDADNDKSRDEKSTVEQKLEALRVQNIPSLTGTDVPPMAISVAFNENPVAECETLIRTPIDCWRCGNSAPAKIVGEPTQATHVASFILCILCLTPCMFLPYWLDCSTTPTKRCAYCGAYLTEPPPRY